MERLDQIQGELIVRTDEGELGEVVQLWIGKGLEKPIFVLGRGGHANVLVWTLQTHQIPYDTSQNLEGDIAPVLHGNGYAAEGMGRAFFKEGKVNYCRQCKSSGYDLRPDLEHVDIMNAICGDIPIVMK